MPVHHQRGIHPVFVIEGGEAARFVPIAPPEDQEVEALLVTVIRKVARLGLPGGDGGWTADEDAFAALQAAEVDRRLRFPDPFKRARRTFRTPRGRRGETSTWARRPAGVVVVDRKG